MTYSLNLTKCLKSKGLLFDPGEERGFEFYAVTFNPNRANRDQSNLNVHFERVP